MAHNRPVDPAPKRRESLLFDPGLWLFTAIILFLGWASTPLARFGPQQGEKAKVQATETQVEQFKTAVQLYTVDNGQPPTAAQGLDALIHTPKKAPKPKHWKKYLPDLNEIPMDPWGDDYVYQFPSPRGEPFLILSCGPDGKPGTKDDITSSAPKRDTW